LYLEPVENLDSIRTEWTELAEECDNVFWTWEWQSLWWQHFGKGRLLMARALRSGDGRLIAILPLYIANKSPLRIIRFIGHGHGDNLGPICRAADSDLIADALRHMLASHQFDLLLGDHVAAKARWAVGLGTKMLRRTGYPVLRFGVESWEEFLASRSSNFRKQARRRERQLSLQHEVSFRLCEDAERLQSDLDELYRLHTQRFGKHQDCWFCGANEQFHREFSARALEKGWLRLWILELDGKPAVAWYGFRFQGIEFSYQSGRDPAWNHASLGFIIEVHAIRQALEGGMREYRFLEGPEDYKYRFANADPGLETIGVAGSAIGRITLAAAVSLKNMPFVVALGKRLAR
jgi:CelD/BcsL family acetyltransferase involved in cellulose biosynthesis